MLLAASWLLVCAADGHAGADAPDRVAGSWVVAIDVGHGRSDPGTTSARGVPEYRFNDRLAREVQSALGAVDVKTLLVNGNGALVGSRGLDERTRVANAAHADLLVSIHHDSVQERYLEAWSFKGRSRRYCDRFAGYSIFYSAGNPQAERSRRFAELLADELRVRGLRPSLHHAENIDGERRDLIDPARGIYRTDFRVIKHSAMPAVLLEAGIIVNRDEEARLAGVRYRKRIVDSVVAATIRFREK